MAYAYRQFDFQRRILIRLSKDLPRTTNQTIYLIINNIPYTLNGYQTDDRLILLENHNSSFESVLLSASELERIALLVQHAEPGIPDLMEPLTFHYSFWVRFFDFARDSDIFSMPGHYTKPGSLAVFTHVYNDNRMLKIWESYYSRIVPAKDLYVIDHGSTESPKELLSAEVNLVSIPRGPSDQRAITQFCNTFQRFLLSQYHWVLHVDADELLVHARGWDQLKENLLNNRGLILKAAHGVNVVHDLASEPALDPAAPISLQRNRLVSEPGCAKPVLSSVPTTWREGFHTVFETHALIEDEDLWLIHLNYVDLEMHLEKDRRWAAMGVSEQERKTRPQSYHKRPPVGVDELSRIFSQMLEKGPEVAFPEWMRGMF